MQVDVELLPAINSIIANTEMQLEKLVGTPIRLKMRILNDEINETFIQNLVCEQFEVTWTELLTTSRKQKLVDARAVYWWLCRKYIGISLLKLAKQFDKDHTTVLHATQKVNDLIDTRDTAILPKLKEIERNINA